MKKTRTLVVLVVLIFSYSITLAFATVWSNKESLNENYAIGQVLDELWEARVKIGEDANIGIVFEIDVTPIGKVIPNEQALMEYCEKYDIPKSNFIYLVQSFKPKLTHIAVDEWDQNSAWQYFTQEDIEEIKLYFSDFDESISKRITMVYAIVCNRIYSSGEFEITPEIQELLDVYDEMIVDTKAEIIEKPNNQYYIMLGIVSATSIILFLVTRTKKKQAVSTHYD